MKGNANCILSYVVSDPQIYTLIIVIKYSCFLYFNKM